MELPYAIAPPLAVAAEPNATMEPTIAELATRAGLPRILPRRRNQVASENAWQYPPPSLNKFRTAASREPADAPPVLWYWQMTGEQWDRKSHSYEVCLCLSHRTHERSADECGSIRVWQLARKSHWRMLEDNQAKENEREETEARARDRKNNQAKYRQKRKLEAIEQCPQQLENGILRCPWHAASLATHTRRLERRASLTDVRFRGRGQVPRQRRRHHSPAARARPPGDQRPLAEDVPRRGHQSGRAAARTT